MSKNMSIFYVVVFMALISCHHKHEPVDLKSAENAVTEVMQKFNAATKAHDIEAVGAYITEGALICGTDKSEFWNKTQSMKMMAENLATVTEPLNYSIIKSEIKTSSDGKSAIVIEQYIMPEMFGPDLPIRSISYLVNTESGWLIDFFSWNVIPDNEDLAKIAAALAE